MKLNTSKLKADLALLEKQRGNIKNGNEKLTASLDEKIKNLKATIDANEETPAKTSKPAKPAKPTKPVKEEKVKPAAPKKAEKAPAKASAAPSGEHKGKAKEIMAMDIPRHAKHQRLFLAGFDKVAIAELTASTTSNVGRDLLAYKNSKLKLAK